VSTSCALQHMKGEREIKTHLGNRLRTLLILYTSVSDKVREPCHATHLGKATRQGGSDLCYAFGALQQHLRKFRTFDVH